VTGGARGMGNAIARAYAEANANGIALIDVRDDLGQNELEELRAAYPKTHFEYYHLDISDYEEVKNERCCKHFF
jgi:sorbose reductase